MWREFVRGLEMVGSSISFKRYSSKWTSIDITYSYSGSVKLTLVMNVEFLFYYFTVEGVALIFHKRLSGRLWCKLMKLKLHHRTFVFKLLCGDQRRTTRRNDFVWSNVCQDVSVSVCQCVSVSVCQCVSVSVCQCVSVSV